MANEITYTGKADLFLAAALNKAVLENLVDESDLRSTCTNRGTINGQGSIAEEQVGVTYDDAMAAANTDETTKPGNTDLGTSTVTITVARQVIVRHVTDLYGIAGGAAPGVARLADKLTQSAVLRYTDMVCALFGSLSNSVGTSGVSLSVDTVMAGLYQLIQARVPAPYYGVFAPIPMNAFSDSLRGEGGSAQWQDATEALQSVPDSWPGYGIRGTWRGIQFWDVDSVNTSGSDKENAMYGRGTFGFKEGIPTEIQQYAAPGSMVKLTPDGAPVYVEFERDAVGAHTLVVGNYYVGVSELEDARGVLVTASAT